MCIFLTQLRKKDFVVLTMDIAVNRRQEQRLCYRWPISFASSVKEKPSPGQIVDVSSWNLAFLCHADKNCPRLEELTTIDFGVPYFGSTDSFDTIFFNRIGRVCRIDELTNLVNRVVIQFARPLFFKPGEQNISESDAIQRLEAKAQSISKAEEEARLYSDELLKAQEKTHSSEQAKEKAEQKLKDEIKARCNAEAKAEAQEKARIEAQSTAEAEMQARLEIQKHVKYEIEAIKKAHAEELVRFEERIKSYAEANDRIEEQLKAEIEARCKAEAKLITQVEHSQKAKEKAKYKVRSRVQAQEKAETEACRRKKLEDQMQHKIKSYDDQIVNIKAEASEEIAKVKSDVADIIAGLKSQLKQNPDLFFQDDVLTEKKINIKTIPSAKSTLMEKLDKLIKNRGIIY
ncbi:MAG: hypothetical protein GY774_26385 [Planctomycetes bacterium]|nr:hypothetical protein [Planctomycetota bacterium]